PCRSRAAKQRYELASFHALPPVLRRKGSTARLRCGISIWRMSASGHSRPNGPTLYVHLFPVRPRYRTWTDSVAEVLLSATSRHSHRSRFCYSIASAGADQLASLLGPYAAAAGEHPRRAGTGAVAIAAHDRSVAVGGQRDGPALHGA